jgi:hypothetical protein
MKNNKPKTRLKKKKPSNHRNSKHPERQNKKITELQKNPPSKCD